MKKNTLIMMRAVALIVIVIFTLPPGIRSEDAGQQQHNEALTKEELVQMLAPIALYPDSLVAPVLMAATYPIEVVEAERWLRQNTTLKGDELDKALQKMPWDPSVKTLCHFPDVLFALSEKLDQTRRLGDAFLSQESDVMATIQELRRKARDQGNLATTKEQRVIVEEDVIRIEPSDPLVVYVPVYDPFYVYGPWWYPSYPPYYWYYPPGFVLSGGYIGFGYGFYVGIGISSWAWFDWHNHHIHHDHHKIRGFHRTDRFKRSSASELWRHDPNHRRGVVYRDRTVSERFGLRPSQTATSGTERRAPSVKGIERKAGPSPQSPQDLRVGSAVSGGRTEPKRIETPTVPKGPIGRVDSPAVPKAPVGITDTRPSGQTGYDRGPISSPAAEPRGQSIESGRQGSMGIDSGGFQGSRGSGGGLRESGGGGGFRR